MAFTILTSRSWHSEDDNVFTVPWVQLTLQAFITFSCSSSLGDRRNTIALHPGPLPWILTRIVTLVPRFRLISSTLKQKERHIDYPIIEEALNTFSDQKKPRFAFSLTFFFFFLRNLQSYLTWQFVKYHDHDRAVLNTPRRMVACGCYIMWFHGSPSADGGAGTGPTPCTTPCSTYIPLFPFHIQLTWQSGYVRNARRLKHVALHNTTSFAWQCQLNLRQTMPSDSFIHSVAGAAGGILAMTAT